MTEAFYTYIWGNTQVFWQGLPDIRTLLAGIAEKAGDNHFFSP